MFSGQNPSATKAAREDYEGEFNFASRIHSSVHLWPRWLCRSYCATGTAFLRKALRSIQNSAARLVRESLVIDMLNQFLYRMDKEKVLNDWLSRPGLSRNRTLNSLTRA